MRTIALAVTLFFLTTHTYAQQPKIGCVNKSMRIQAEQMKHDFKAQGMEVYKDAMLGMRPGEPAPVAIQLAERQMYQFILIGDANAAKIYFELYDGQNNKLVEKTIKKNDDNNFIIYSFVPQKTDLYLVVLTQKIKGKADVCGSFTIMQNAPAANSK